MGNLHDQIIALSTKKFTRAAERKAVELIAKKLADVGLNMTANQRRTIRRRLRSGNLDTLTFPICRSCRSSARARAVTAAVRA
jgi:hypothetical protein